MIIGHLLAVFLCLILAGSSEAVKIEMTEEKVESSIVTDDYIFLGKNLAFSGEAEDLVFIGRTLAFAGTAQLGVVAIGRDIVIEGKVGNGVASAGETIRLNGQIKGTSYLVASEIHMTPESVLDGALLGAAAEITLKGRINGDVYVAAGKVVIENEISGNVLLRGGQIKILEGGKILGGLNYSTHETLTEEELGRVIGKVEYVPREKGKEPAWYDRVFSGQFGLIAKIALLFSFIISGLLLLFFPATRVLEAERSSREFWFTSLWGLIPLLMYPVVILLSLVLIVTIPFGIVLILMGLPILFFANIIGITLLGRYLSDRFNWNIQKRHVLFLLGAVLYGFVLFIPYVSILMRIFSWSLGCGVILFWLFGKNLARG